MEDEVSSPTVEGQLMGFKEFPDDSDRFYYSFILSLFLCSNV